MALFPEDQKVNPEIEGALSVLDRQVLDELSNTRKDCCSVLVLPEYFNQLSDRLREILTSREDLDSIDRLLVLAYTAVKSKLEDELLDWAIGTVNPGYLRFQERMGEVKALAHWSWNRQGEK